MADSRAVAVKRAKADLRLKQVAQSASSAFGVPFQVSTTPANRYPDLAAAELVENVADFIERITQSARPASASPGRKAVST